MHGDRAEQVPIATRLAVVQRETGEYLTLRYQAELRRRVAERAQDEQMKKAVIADLVRIEAALDTFREERSSLEIEQREEEASKAVAAS